LNWVIRDLEGAALGTLQATIPIEDSAAEIAWLLRVEAQGRGYASEAVRELIRSLASRGVTEFVAHIHPDHGASQQVAAAVGMSPTEEWSDEERLWRLSLEAGD
jgi:RimJ/RimL family protein N-acetyltransferase